MATGAWVYGALQVAVATAMVVGLCQEIYALLHSRGLWQTRSGKISAAWRATTAIALTAGVVEKVFALQINRWLRDSNVESFVWSDPVDVLFVVTSVLVLCVSISRLSAADRTVRPGRRRVRLVLIVGLFLALTSLHLRGEIHSYVHNSVEGIERGHPLRFQRVGAYPDHAAEGYQFFWLACGATAAVLISVFLLLAISRSRTKSHLVALSAALIVCQGCVVAFDLWYYFRALPHVSPDLADAGMQATPADWLLAAVIAVAAVTVAAYVLTTMTSDAEEPAVACRRPLHHSNLIVSMAVLGAIAFPIELAIASFSFVSGTANALSQSNWTVFLWTLRDYVQDPPTLLSVAWCLAAMKLALLRWKRSDALEQIRVPSFRARSFAISFVGIAIVAATGIPALSAFCFASWFSPWS